jgi:hypothetical protein
MQIRIADTVDNKTQASLCPHSKEISMLRRVMMVLATTVALAGALSADAFARGAPVGPMGQIFDGVNPVDHPFIFGPAGKAYGYAYGYVGFPHARPQARSHGYERR